jgi:transposase
MWDMADPLLLSSEQRRTLETWVAARTSPQRLIFRSRIVLLAAAGMSNRKIASELKTSRPTVILWRQRFAEAGPVGLEEDASGRGRKPRIGAKKIKEIVEATLHTKPEDATHWSVRTMAAAQGVSPASVQRIWDAHGLEPHRVRTFKISRDRRFVEKLTDVVGLYLSPPDKALVLCVDEKTQIQALNRTQPGLPMKKGRCGTMTHDYKRNGITTLFAALNVLDGTVIGSCMPRHRHEEFLHFLRKINRETPAGLDLHLIVDNASTHKHANVKAWLSKHPRFHLHFTPTSSSWLNLIERWFGELTRKRIRRDSFYAVSELIAAIEQYIKTNNEQPRPFVWTARIDDILARINHCKAILETAH